MTENKIFVLFANGRSGSRRAQEYLSLDLTSLSFKQGESTYEVRIFDLFDKSSRDLGVEFIASQSGVDMRVLVAGGDGSLPWLLQTCLHLKTDISKLHFGILPFGTGNDLSASLGWGRSPPRVLLGPHLSSFKSYVHDWSQASSVPFDVWEVQIECEENGYIKSLDSSETPAKRFMTNYFSIGLDASIGAGFDTHRTSSKTCNRLMYCWEGFKQLCCGYVPALYNYTQALLDESTSIFDSQQGQELPKNSSILLALNIRTYGGGNNYVWERSRKQIRDCQWKQPGYSDNVLEFLSFEGAYDLAMEQVSCCAGRAKKIHQGKGPFYIKLSPDPGDRKVYMQCDGQYFYAVRPKSVTISLAEISKTQTVRLLKKHN